MHALRRSHRTLTPGGILLDMMPVSAWHAIESRGAAIGRVDSREHAATVRKVEAALAETVARGLFARERTVRFDVREHFETAGELIEIVGAWRQTRLPERVAARVRRSETPFAVRERMVLRRLRAL